MLCLFFKKSEKNSVHLLKSMVEYKYIIKKGVDFMYYTILTAIDNYGGKSFFNGSAKTESKSVDRAIEQFTIHKLDDDDSIHSIRTWNNIKDVSLKAVRT
tara:strand:- start:179 stop:478 length:300 start_codon:yes stop_codon:yes gene_type:complete